MSDALELCRTEIARHGKSFALASRLLRPEERDAAAVLYAWCRRADDAIDLVAPPHQAAALERLRDELERVYTNKPLTDPTLVEFRRIVNACAIPEVYPRELLAGMEMDVKRHVSATWDELLWYSYRVASPVGIMTSPVLGVRSEQALPHAIDLGIAMQLTNIARDVREDWHRERLYLPDELLVEHGLPRLREHLGGVLLAHHRERLRPIVRELVEVADRYYQSADRGLVYLSKRNAWGVAAARFIYCDIGRRLAERRFD